MARTRPLVVFAAPKVRRGHAHRPDRRRDRACRIRRCPRSGRGVHRHQHERLGRRFAAPGDPRREQRHRLLDHHVQHPRAGRAHDRAGDVAAPSRVHRDHRRLFAARCAREHAARRQRRRAPDRDRRGSRQPGDGPADRALPVGRPRARHPRLRHRDRARVGSGWKLHPGQLPGAFSRRIGLGHDQPGLRYRDRARLRAGLRGARPAGRRHHDRRVRCPGSQRDLRPRHR